MTRPAVTFVVVVVGLLLLADFVIVNQSLAGLAAVVVNAVILVSAGVALAAVASLGIRRSTDLARRRGDPVAAGLVLAGMAAMLLAGLRPGSDGAGDPAVQWLAAALLFPIGATLFALLFVSTLAAARRSLAEHRRDAGLMLAVAALTALLLLPIGGEPGTWLATAADVALAVPIGAVFRGLLIGVAVLTAMFAARTLLGVGPRED